MGFGLVYSDKQSPLEFEMVIDEVVVQIDAEVERLQQVRRLLVGGGSSVGNGVRKVGRPPKKKRNLSEEGRRRIAEAVRRRWAKQRAKVK